MLNNIRVRQNTKEIVLEIDAQVDDYMIMEELEEKLPKLKDFYKDSQVPIKVTGKVLNRSEKILVERLIREIIDVEVKFEESGASLGLHTIKKTFELDTEISETKYIYNSIRSGNKEEFLGSLVICGDVNFGAEVIAGGNIIILGVLRGVAHAGANGNNKAIIAANTVEATQLRISNLVKQIDEKEDKCPIFEIKNGQICSSDN